MNLSEISIRRPVMAWMLFTAIIIFGVISFNRLGISQLPDVDFPVISVQLRLNGAAPGIIENQVLDPIEDAIMQIEGVKNITSNAQQSSGNISIEFELGRNVDTALEEVQNHINQVRHLLPLNLQPPTLRKTNPEDQPIMWLALTTDDPNTPLIDIMMYARNVLYDQFSTVSGVGNIFLGGYVDPALRVWIDQDKLTSLNLTAEDILQSIIKEHREMPAGRLEDSKKEYNLRVLGEATTPFEFGKISIDTRVRQGPNYKLIRLKDVAQIEEGTVDIRRISRSNGKSAIGLGIVKQHGSNAVEVAQAVRKKLEEISPLLPSHFRIDVRSDNTRFISDSLNELLFILAISAICTSLVCFLFMGSWRSTMNVLFAIPTSIIGSFIILYFFNFTLNTFTLLGLSLAIGIVVDDAIMMLENIIRHQELGEEKVAAAIIGAKEITFAAIASTLAIVAIFLPVIFMKGIIGRYFFQYGITVTAAVLFSLLEALTLTPMRCSKFLEIKNKKSGHAYFTDTFFKRLSHLYEILLRFLLSHKWKVIVVSMSFFLGSFFVAKILPSEMIPVQDQSMLFFKFKLPVGTSINATNEKIKAVEKYLLKKREVDGIFTAIGGFGADAVNQGNAFVVLVPKKNRLLSQQEIIKIFRKELHGLIPGMEIIIQDLSLRGFSASRGFPVEFIVQGTDWDKLTAATNLIMAKMKSSGVVTDVNTDVQSGMPEVQIIPDRKKMAEYAISLNTVTNALNILVGGLILNRDTEYSKDRHRFPVELRLKPSQRNTLPDLNRIMLRNNRGETIALSKVVTKKINPSLMLISRLNRSRAITVYANPAPGHSQQEALSFAENLAKKILPPGYSMKISGSSQGFKESFQSLFFALILGLLVSYMVLASQFNSFIHPITVLVALPFSFAGAFLGLFIFHQSINMYSMIGLILLMGIVKKNSILLVDFTNKIRAEGGSIEEALIKACPIRLRPIMMTSLATIAGALPGALSLGPGAETRIPMATAIIGGVIASTILTLLVVPCVYSLMSKLEKKEGLKSTSHIRPNL